MIDEFEQISKIHFTYSDSNDIENIISEMNKKHGNNTFQNIHDFHSLVHEDIEKYLKEVFFHNDDGIGTSFTITQLTTDFNNRNLKKVTPDDIENARLLFNSKSCNLRLKKEKEYYKLEKRQYTISHAKNYRLSNNIEKSNLRKNNEQKGYNYLAAGNDAHAYRDYDGKFGSFPSYDNYDD